MKAQPRAAGRHGLASLSATGLSPRRWLWSCSACSSFRCSASRSVRARASSRWPEAARDMRRCRPSSREESVPGSSPRSRFSSRPPTPRLTAAARGVAGVQLAAVGATSATRRSSTSCRRTPQWTAPARRSSKMSGPRSRPRSAATSDHRSRRGDRGLLQCRVRQVPVRPAADRVHHVPPAGADVPVRAPAAQGCPAQPDLTSRRLRCDGVLLAEGTRVGRGLQCVGHRRDQLLAAGGDLRVPVRPFDGLRGLHHGRMREEYDRTGDTSKAVVTGISRTAGSSRQPH